MNKIQNENGLPLEGNHKENAQARLNKDLSKALNSS